MAISLPVAGVLQRELETALELELEMMGLDNDSIMQKGPPRLTAGERGNHLACGKPLRRFCQKGS